MTAPHIYEHRVRYREADPMGIVYHVHYLDYFEAARTEALRSTGATYKAIEDGGMFMPVVDLAIAYHKPARYDDLLHIKTTPELSDSGTRLTFHYEVVRKDESDVLATGHVTLCFYDRESRRPIRAPEELRSLIHETPDSGSD